MKKTFSLTVCLLGLAFMSCTNSDSNSSSNNNNPGPVDVYVAGMEFPTTAGTYNKAVYWKNNQPTYLTDGTHWASSEKIRVVNQDVYVLGTENNDAGHAVFKLWKNGTVIPFLPNENCYVYDFWIDGNDIHAVGTTANQQIAYWKNGIQTLLINNNDLLNNVGAVKVVNNDVYITGYSAALHTPVYWKNGILHTLENLENNPMAPVFEGIEIVNNDVYFIANYPAYTEDNAPGQPQYGVYWKNGLINIVAEDTYTRGISVSDNDVYIICDDFEGTCYYKNGQRIGLSNGTIASEIKILNGTIFATGSIYNSKTGLLWINDVQSSYEHAFTKDLYIVQN